MDDVGDAGPYSHDGPLIRSFTCGNGGDRGALKSVTAVLAVSTEDLCQTRSFDDVLLLWSPVFMQDEPVGSSSRPGSLPPCARIWICAKSLWLHAAWIDSTLARGKITRFFSSSLVFGRPETPLMTHGSIAVRNASKWASRRLAGMPGGPAAANKMRGRVGQF